MEHKSYKKGDTVQLRVVVKAPAGLDIVEAVAYSEDGTSRIGLFHQSDGTHKGNVSAPIRAAIGDRTPGTYTCSEVKITDNNGETTRHPISPKQFRIAPSKDVAEPPEVIEVGEFE